MEPIGVNVQESLAVSNSCPVERPITVLLIDDQAIIGEAVRRMLLPEDDIAFYYCSNPVHAIDVAVQVAPTVILQDLLMPDMDGLMLARSFRSHRATHDIPLIVLSTKDEPNIKAEAFAIGANDYLVKLPDKVELIARIRYHSKAYINLQASTTAFTARIKAQELEQAFQELRSTQAQLIQAEKMSGLGQMVAGVAHEINNPVNFIQGNLDHVAEYVRELLELLQLYHKEYPTPTAAIQSYAESIDLDFIAEDLPKTLASMKIGTERIRQIVLSMRNFSRLDEAEKKQADIHAGIDSTLLILNHRIKNKIGIVKQYDNLPLVECYPAQLNQVFMNVLSNAIDALLEQPEESTKQIVIQTRRVSSDQVEVRIRDNGPGIPLGIKDKLFNPFFTTKPIGKGTGLGLAICYQIMEKHQGKIEVHSELHRGTEFVIQLALLHS